MPGKHHDEHLEAFNKKVSIFTAVILIANLLYDILGELESTSSNLEQIRWNTED